MTLLKRSDFVALEKYQSTCKSTTRGKRAGKLVAAATTAAAAFICMVELFCSSSHQLVLPGDVIVFPTTDPQPPMRLVKAQTALCWERCVFFCCMQKKGQNLRGEAVHAMCSRTRSRCNTARSNLFMFFNATKVFVKLHIDIVGVPVKQWLTQSTTHPENMFVDGDEISGLVFERSRTYGIPRKGASPKQRITCVSDSVDMSKSKLTHS